MFYLGHFIFDTKGYHTGKGVPGNTTLVCSASNAQEALDNFSDKFVELKKETNLFEGVNFIYLESLVEIKGDVTEPIVCKITKPHKSKGPGFTTEHISLPGVEENLATAYSFEPEEDGSMSPFVTFVPEDIKEES